MTLPALCLCSYAQSRGPSAQPDLLSTSTLSCAQSANAPRRRSFNLRPRGADHASCRARFCAVHGRPRKRPRGVAGPSLVARRFVTRTSHPQLHLRSATTYPAAAARPTRRQGSPRVARFGERRPQNKFCRTWLVVTVVARATLKKDDINRRASTPYSLS